MFGRFSWLTSSVYTAVVDSRSCVPPARYRVIRLSETVRLDEITMIKKKKNQTKHFDLKYRLFPVTCLRSYWINSVCSREIKWKLPTHNAEWSIRTPLTIFRVVGNVDARHKTKIYDSASRFGCGRRQTNGRWLALVQSHRVLGLVVFFQRVHVVFEQVHSVLSEWGPYGTR